MIPDLIGENCKLLFVGINPGLQTAMTGIHFAHHSNRFWPALKKAGIIDWVPNVSPVAPSVPMGCRSKRLWTAATSTHFCHPSNRFYPALQRAGFVGWAPDTGIGMTDQQRTEFTSRGLGITNLVARATVRASELSSGELRDGALALEKLVTALGPSVVAIAGVSAYRSAFSRPKAKTGRQLEPLADADLWVVPNPSGLNAHETIESLADSYREVGQVAGVL